MVPETATRHRFYPVPQDNQAKLGCQSKSVLQKLPGQYMWGWGGEELDVEGEWGQLSDSAPSLGTLFPLWSMSLYSDRRAGAQV